MKSARWSRRRMQGFRVCHLWHWMVCEMSEKRRRRSQIRRAGRPFRNANLSRLLLLLIFCCGCGAQRQIKSVAAAAEKLSQGRTRLALSAQFCCQSTLVDHREMHFFSGRTGGRGGFALKRRICPSIYANQSVFNLFVTHSV